MFQSTNQIIYHYELGRTIHAWNILAKIFHQRGEPLKISFYVHPCFK